MQLSLIYLVMINEVLRVLASDIPPPSSPMLPTAPPSGPDYEGRECQIDDEVGIWGSIAPPAIADTASETSAAPSATPGADKRSASAKASTKKALKPGIVSRANSAVSTASGWGSAIGHQPSAPGIRKPVVPTKIEKPSQPSLDEWETDTPLPKKKGNMSLIY